jgi:hypothetical protein
MLHPFTTAELVRQRRAALDTESRNSGSSASSSPGLAPILRAADSCQRHEPLPPTSAPWWPAPPEDQPPIRVVGNVDCNANSVL